MSSASDLLDALGALSYSHDNDEPFEHDLRESLENEFIIDDNHPPKATILADFAANHAPRRRPFLLRASIDDEIAESHSPFDEATRIELDAVANECAVLQSQELARLPVSRFDLLETSDGARLVTLRGDLWTVQMFVGPLYPLRDGPDVRLECHADADAAFVRAVTVAIRDVSRARGRELVAEALIAAIDASVARLLDERQSGLMPTFGALKLSGVEPGSEPAAFLGGVAVAPFGVAPGWVATAGESVVQLGTQLFVIGGVPLKGTAAELPIVRILNLVTRTWSAHQFAAQRSHLLPATLGELSTFVGRAAVRAAKDKILVFGARTSLQVGRLARTMVLDTDTLSWDVIDDAPFPASLSLNTATRVGNLVWLIGGHVTDMRDTGRSDNDRFIYAFDLQKMAYVTWPCPCRCTHYCSVCKYARRVHNLVVAMPDKFASLPSIREHTATRVGGRFIFLAGGVQGMMVSGAAWLIDTVGLGAVEVDVALPARPRAGHAAILLRDRFVALVGGRTVGDMACPHIDLFDLADKVWITRLAAGLPPRVGGALIPSADGRLLSLFGFSEHNDRVAKGSWRAGGLRTLRAAAPACVFDIGLPSVAPRSQLARELLALLESGSFSDVQFRGFRLHRVVLQARCPALLEQLERGEVRGVDDLDDEAFGDFFRHLYGDAAIEGPRLRAALANIFHLTYLHDDEAAPSVQASLGALFDDDERRGKYADVTFEADGGETLRVHRVFASRAAHFERALGAGMREAQTGTIRVDDVEAASLRALLRFLYTDELVCEAEHAVEVLALADRCQLAALKQHAEVLLESFYDFSELANVCDLIDIAQRYGAEHVRRAALNVLSDFERAAVLEHLESHQHELSELSVQTIRNVFV